MAWDIPLLIGFLLLFNAWASPAVDDAYFVDSNGIKHYVAVPEITSYDNNVDDFTNSLFLKYEDPWSQPASLILMSITSITSLMYFRSNTIQTLLKTNNLSIKNINFFNKTSRLGNHVAFNNSPSHQISVSRFFKVIKNGFFIKQKKLSIKLSVICILVLFLSPFYFAPTFAQNQADTIDLTDFQSCSQGSGNTCTTGAITPDFTDVVIIAVAIIQEDGAALRDVSTIVFAGGDSLAGGEIISQGSFTNTNTRIRIFEIADPTETTGTVIVTLDGSDNDLGVGVYVIAGAQEGSFIGASTNGGNVDPTDDITPTDTNSLVIGVTAHDGDATSVTSTDTLNLSAQTTAVKALVGFSSGETGADLNTETRLFTRVDATTTDESITLAFEIQGGVFQDDDLPTHSDSAIAALSVEPDDDVTYSDSTFVELDLGDQGDDVTHSDKATAALGVEPDDDVTYSDSATFTIGRIASDTTTYSDSTFVELVVKITDTVTHSDSTFIIAPGQVVTDTVTYSDRALFLLSNGGLDVTTILDSASLSKSLKATTVEATITLPAGGSASSTQETAPADPTPSAGGTLVLFATVVDITFSSNTVCDDGCTISFDFVQADLDAAGIATAAEISIFEDPEEDGSFNQLTTTLTDGEPSPFTVTATTFADGTDFGLGKSTPAPVTTGGGGGGDETDPSIFVGFADDEFPIILDGVKYKAYQLDDAHTTIAEIGKQVSFTIMVYENSGPNSVQHVEMYVNHFGSLIKNVLSETSIIYDGQPEIEIIDTNGIISSVDVAVSQPNNKAAFTFAIVFDKEFPESDIMFRIWDISRNSMDIHIPNALMVVSSQQVSVGEIIEEEAEPEVAEAEPIVPEAVPVVPVPTIPTPEPEIPVPEVPIATKMGWYDREISVLKKWGGFDVDIASDIEVLAEFGVKGEIIPSYFKQTVKWVIQDQISQQDFVNALQFFKSKGLLSDEIQKQSFVVETANRVQSLVLDEDSFDDNIKFDFGEENTLYTKANFETIQDKVTTIMALANNEQIRNELLKSNEEFASATDSKTLIDQREVEWLRNPKTITPFMDSLMNNEAALIAKALIEHDKEHIIPIESIMITNAYGVNAIITEKTHDYKQSDEKWWGKAKKLGEYLMTGSGSEDSGGSQYKGEIILAINDGEGNFIGIIKAVVNLDKVLLS